MPKRKLAFVQHVNRKQLLWEKKHHISEEISSSPNLTKHTQQEFAPSYTHTLCSKNLYKLILFINSKQQHAWNPSKFSHMFTYSTMIYQRVGIKTHMWHYCVFSQLNHYCVVHLLHWMDEMKTPESMLKSISFIFHRLLQKQVIMYKNLECWINAYQSSSHCGCFQRNLRNTSYTLKRVPLHLQFIAGFTIASH